MQIFAKPLMVGWRFRFPSFLFRLCPPGHRSGIINAENIGQSSDDLARRTACGEPVLSLSKGRTRH